ncbi:LysR substrate-binding domain-containing protein [Ramlibacter sp. WS9]|uniref:LysR substrate-binding domain-containing protein n=1 Tax=Ramlibacter sp. WS9 TaxID=1882741 RepID=UPI0011428ADD|nr:LysR substrate-binding domain-containing protein [Ramlibacter sp. WS9]ROZ72117.1 LysR family transcriptional regulator [Ramlibacter sp. WS9]
MPIRSPSLVELHAFLAVARTGSFRKAADELCVTQAAVSRAVLRLEEDLGQDVLQRSAGGVTLTPAGLELRKLVGKPVAALEAAAVKLRKKPERLRLRLSVITSLGTLWLMPRLEDFRERHPEVEIEFRQYHHDEDFTRDDVDVWIDTKRNERQWPRQVSARYVIGGEIVAVCTPKLAKGVRTAQQLLAQPLLYHSNFPDNWPLWASTAGASMPVKPKRTGFDLVLNLIEAARSGMGVAVVQECMVEADLASGRLVMPVPVSASTGRGYHLCRRRAQGAHPAADLFSEWVLAQAHQGV